MTRISRKVQPAAFAAAALAIAAAMTGPAMAQPAQPAPLNTTPTNLPGHRAFVAPPEGFDPLTATDTELAQFGYPPRPDAFAPEAVQKAWQKAVTVPTERVIPELQEMPNVQHGPVRNSGSIENTDGTSSNWSGSVLVTGGTAFASVQSDWIVPSVVPPNGACGGQWYSSAWVGIDGAGSDDVLQAGTDQDVSCSQDSPKANYSAWYEWYPDYSHTISNFPIMPGQSVAAYVWQPQPGQGSAYLVNYSTQKAVSVTFSAPGGTKLVGNTAEFIVERPFVDGKDALLPWYGHTVFTSAFAHQQGGTGVSGTSSSDPGITRQRLTMTDDSRSPISVPVDLGDAAILLNGVPPAK